MYIAEHAPLAFVHILLKADVAPHDQVNNHFSEEF
jgi:hypothetical protein